MKLITSYLKYAVDAFELSILRYIPKNSLDSRLPHALEDAFNMINVQADNMVTKVRKSLAQVYKELMSEEFNFVNRGDIVNIAHVMGVKNSMVELKN